MDKKGCQEIEGKKVQQYAVYERSEISISDWQL